MSWWNDRSSDPNDFLLYFMVRFCTSIVMQDANGTIWHARNLDYSFTEILRNISIRVDYQKGGKVLNTNLFSRILYVAFILFLSQFAAI